jgi:putative nucleotidyltransferase with HDIG domain
MPIIGEHIRLAQTLMRKLEQDLDGCFSIWSELDGWHPISEFELPHFHQQEALQLARSVLSGGDLGTKATTIAIDADRQFLLIPVQDYSSARYVVVGIVGLHSSKLVCALADSSVAALKQTLRIQDTEGRLSQCMEQLTENFEELAWLRSLTEHFAELDIRNDISQISKSTLESLRQLVDAESLLLLGLPTGVNGELDLQEDLRILLWDGSHIVTEEEVRQLLATTIQGDLPRKTLIWNTPNYFLVNPLIGGVQNYILTPVTKADFQIGWLLAINKNKHGIHPADLDDPELDRNWFEFGTSEAGLMSAMAVLLATHAKNVELLKEKEALLLGVISSLVNAIDAKDAYTGGHSDRVASISKRIAQQMGLSQTDCQAIHLAGLLHDIGKIGVPDGVLGKIERLTAEELALIRLHPTIGVEILQHLEPLKHVLPGVLHHHESLDGNGYPHGLTGEQIPLMSRIIAVADSYDAMVSDRTYRKGMSTEKAEAILQERAGIQWDEQVVEAFMAALPEIYQISYPVALQAT